MPGARPLTNPEERQLVRRTRKISARDRALIMAQLFLGYRISEILALTIGQVTHEGKIRARIALPPRFLKGGYGGTRTVPVANELHRALETYLAQRARAEVLTSAAPLFLSRQSDSNGAQKAVCRSTAEKLIKKMLVKGAEDVTGLSTHSLRKTWASRLYETSGRDLLVVRDGLGHSSVAVTQAYLPTNRENVERLIIASDWTRRSRKHDAKKISIACATPKPDLNADGPMARPPLREPAPTIPPQAAAPAHLPPAPFLPGLENFAA